MRGGSEKSLLGVSRGGGPGYGRVLLLRGSRSWRLTTQIKSSSRKRPLGQTVKEVAKAEYHARRRTAAAAPATVSNDAATFERVIELLHHMLRFAAFSHRV